MKRNIIIKSLLISLFAGISQINFAQTNLIIEPNFETEYSYASASGAAATYGAWTVTNSAAEVAVVIEGLKTLRFTTLAQASFATQIIDFGTTDIQGKTFTLKFTARVASAAGASGSSSNVDQVINASVNVGTVNNPTQAAEMGFPIVANTNSDVEYTKEFTIPTGTEVHKLFLRFHKNKGIGYLDKVSLTEKTASGVHTAKELNVSIVKGINSISVIAPETITELRMLNVNGQIVRQPAICTDPISTAGMPKAVYIITGKLLSGKQFQTKYIIN